MNGMISRRGAVWILFAAFVTAVFCCAAGAAATGEQFDIDLKELRPAPRQRPATPPRRYAPKHSRTAQPPTGNTPEGMTWYTVRPGDFPFLILTSHFHLSQTAADRLVPQVMHLNNLSDPHKLKIGQRLLIPLSQTPQTAPATDTAATPPQQPTAKPQLPSRPPVPGTPNQPQPVPVTREVRLASAPPCQLTDELAGILGWRAPLSIALLSGSYVSMALDGQKLVVACGLSAAETYTAQRLLARHDAQLLLFDGQETPREVLEELADSLNIGCVRRDSPPNDPAPGYTCTIDGKQKETINIIVVVTPAGKSAAP